LKLRRLRPAAEAGSATAFVETRSVAAILTRNRRMPDDEMPEILSDDDLLAWGQSLVDVHVDDWTPDPSPAADGDEAEAVEEAVAEEVTVDGSVAEEVEVEVAEEVEQVDAGADEASDAASTAEGSAVEDSAVDVEEAVADDRPVDEADTDDSPIDEPAVEQVAVVRPQGGTVEAEAEAEAPRGEQPEPIAEQAEPVEAQSVEAEPVAPVRTARISQRRRELVALRRNLAAQAAERRARASRAGHREQPLTGYRPDVSPLTREPQGGAEVRTRLQERLAAATPVAPVRDGQWAAREVAAPTIRVRLAEAD
jgi:hypothetical protein